MQTWEEDVLLGPKRIKGATTGLVDNPAEILALAKAGSDELWPRFKENLNPGYSKKLETAPFIDSLFQQFQPSRFVQDSSSYRAAFTVSIKDYLDHGVPVFFDSPILHLNHIDFHDRRVKNPVITNSLLNDYFVDLFRRGEYNKFFDTILPNIDWIIEQSIEHQNPDPAIKQTTYLIPLSQSLLEEEDPIILGNKKVFSINHYLQKICEKNEAIEVEVRRNIVRGFNKKNLNDTESMIRIYEEARETAVTRAFVNLVTDAEDHLSNTAKLGVFFYHDGDPAEAVNQIEPFIPAAYKDGVPRFSRRSEWDTEYLELYIEKAAQAFIRSFA